MSAAGVDLAQILAAPRDLYGALGVAQDATEVQIRTAFRRRALGLHPDKNPHPRATEAFQVLTRAHDVLRDAERRRTYDRGGYDAVVAEEERGGPPVNITEAIKWTLFFFGRRWACVGPIGEYESSSAAPTPEARQRLRRAMVRELRLMAAYLGLVALLAAAVFAVAVPWAAGEGSAAAAGAKPDVRRDAAQGVVVSLRSGHLSTPHRHALPLNQSLAVTVFSSTRDAEATGAAAHRTRLLELWWREMRVACRREAAQHRASLLRHEREIHAFTVDSTLRRAAHTRRFVDRPTVPRRADIFRLSRECARFLRAA